MSRQRRGREQSVVVSQYGSVSGEVLSSVEQAAPPTEKADPISVHYERIFRAALSLTWERDLAEDIAQETFRAAFTKLDSFSGKSSAFTWLYRIMLNKYRDLCRKKGLLRRLGLVRAEANAEEAGRVSSKDPSPAAELQKSEEREKVRIAVANLPRKLQLVVVMHYFDDLPLTEVSRILNCRLGTVKSRLFAARKRLHQSLEGKF
jgi:RNA polymerase sigma-70 factor (ECF subfamily)